MNQAAKEIIKQFFVTLLVTTPKFRRGYICTLFACASFLFSTGAPASKPSATGSAATSLTVDQVWAGTDVSYDAVSIGPVVYVAYYDSNRQLCVARINTVGRTVQKRTLSSVFAGWDAHNYVTLAYDKFGYLHVAGNMHTSPLIYGRMLSQDDFDSLTRITKMVGQDEASVTYPKFFTFPNGDLGFTYRSGKSGNGVELINKFDGHSWSRYSTIPIFAPSQGGRPVNAYHSGYVRGPDGYFHVAWVWRLSKMAESNFNVNYVRSKDLKHWFDSHGREMTLPLTPDNADIVDKVPPGAGLINNVKLGFDAFNVPIVSYLKYDKFGYTQLYHARPSKKGWDISKITDWHYRWALKGAGTKLMQISFSGVRVHDGMVIEGVKHPDAGSLLFIYSKNAMKAKRTKKPAAHASTECPNISPWIRISKSIISTSPGSYHGWIRWRSLPKDNNDQPRSCNSIGLAEGCRMTSKLILVPAVSVMTDNCEP